MSGKPSEAFELARKSWTYLDGRDLEGFLGIVHEDVEFVSLVAEAEGGTFHGHEGVRVWWESVGEALGGLRYQPQEMEELGESGVLTRVLITGKVADVEVGQEMWHAVLISDGKAEWWGVFRTEPEARDAFASRAGLQ